MLFGDTRKDKKDPDEEGKALAGNGKGRNRLQDAFKRTRHRQQAGIHEREAVSSA